MLRSAALYVLPAMLLVTGWLTLEAGGGGRSAVWLAVIAFLPALASGVRTRAAASAGVAVVAVAEAFGLSLLDARPFDGRHDFFGPLLSRVSTGTLAFYDVSVPFAPREQPEMHGVVLIVLFAFCLATALAIAARRPLLAAVVLLAGAAWPVTLAGEDTLARGAVVLAAVLTLLAGGSSVRPRISRHALVAGAAIVLAAFAASSSPAVAKGEFVSWQRWDLYDRPAEPVSVRYVWDANYGGVTFPKKRTEVMTVAGVRRSMYWRATTLDVYDGDRWRERLPTIDIDEGRVTVRDPLLPPRAAERDRWVTARVSIEALRDWRLPGPAMPVEWNVASLGPVELKSGGVVSSLDELERGDEYTVSAYAPRPTPSQLARVQAAPGGRGRLETAYLEIAPGAAALPFGARGSAERMRNLLASRPVYTPLYEIARRVAGNARNQYLATVRLEAWLRAGEFRYDEQPRLAFGTPPLVSFVTRFREGYCQQFAGTMALMLRFLGIPARVAAGFTSGRYDVDDRRWRVTDRDAHTWVEVWFDGWGWLPFDPTPGRGQLRGTYTVASPNFGAGTRPQFRRDVGGNGLRADAPVGRDVPGDVATLETTARERGGSLLKLLALVAAALGAAIAVAKLLRRARRLLARGPRRVAAACRDELTDFLADQRVPAPRSATVGELGAAVEERLGVDAYRFVRAVEAARFAPERDAAAAARRARRELRALRRRMRARLTLRSRIRGLFSVRSLGLAP